jgi:hypothetical protein
MTSFKTISATAASFTAGLCLLSVSGNAAQANPFNTFGIQGGCNSLAINDRGSARNCDEHRNWTSREAGRNRQHSTQSQLIGLGGGLIGQLINGSQRRQQQRTSRPSAELALIQQQQNQREIDRLKQQLEAQSNNTPQRGMPTGTAPRRGNAFDARSIQRSVNLARDTAIRINGGLSEYRPGKCMFRGSDRNPCITQSGPQGILFQIPGGPPGWEETTAQPSTITILLIAPDGRTVLQTISNGALQTQQPNLNNYPYPAKNYPQH